MVERCLVDAVFQYTTESRYPVKCREMRQRAIRKNAAMFIVRDGVMFSKQEEKRSKYTNTYNGIMDYHPLLHH